MSIDQILTGAGLFVTLLVAFGVPYLTFRLGRKTAKVTPPEITAESGRVVDVDALHVRDYSYLIRHAASVQEQLDETKNELAAAQGRIAELEAANAELRRQLAAAGPTS